MIGHTDVSVVAGRHAIVAAEESVLVGSDGSVSVRARGGTCTTAHTTQAAWAGDHIWMNGACTTLADSYLSGNWTAATGGTC